MIEVKNVTKVYGKKESAFVALKNVSFSIPEGATVAIVGKSGSGKSTLMHVMSGLDHPDEGRILIDGRDIHKLKRKAQDKFRAETMSFIFQAFFVEGNQTVYQNVSLPLEIAKVRRGRRKKMIMDALDKVELQDKVDNKAKNLSGGQKQRLAIARAIVNTPKLIFADEPTGNLDSTTGDKIVELLFDLNRTLKCTLIIVTHDEELAARCQMRLTMKDGALLSAGQAAQTPRATSYVNRGGDMIAFGHTPAKKSVPSAPLLQENGAGRSSGARQGTAKKGSSLNKRGIVQ